MSRLSHSISGPCASGSTALGPDHPNVATSLNNLALLYKCLGLYEQAKPLSLGALHIREHSLGPDHPDVATSLKIWQNSIASRESMSQAKPLSCEPCTSGSTASDLTIPMWPTSLNNLAELYRKQGKYEQAQPLSLRALHIREHSLGPDHHLTQQVPKNSAL